MSELKEALINISEEVRTKVIPENIKAGVQIFGVEGGYAGLDTTDATATAEDILKDKTAYVNGEKVVGNMEISESTSNATTPYEINGTATTTAGIARYIISIDDEVKIIDNGNYLFYGCVQLNHIKKIITTGITKMGYMFTDCRAMETAPEMDTSSTTNFSSMFKGCTNLKNIPVYDSSSCTAFNSMFEGCNNLTDESLNNILAMCISMPKQSTLKLLGFTSSYYPVTRLQTLSNYQAFLDAGWTTGY